ncbi:peptidoglycan DD-metalloendopeptidase family protein [Salinibacter altiplanensis]|uniref:peptidoglycan DD-metalloendopeptidase family protein n=1 Tax=Salinibacter altiplanensis TaxID=1803181 RepID=UPI000C9FC90D|nr:peptidoglycan DD-metalloendopeptidase family protein [Salinibacter altiplanensis]
MSFSLGPLRLLAVLLVVAGGALACQTGATAPPPEKEANGSTATFEASADGYGLPAGRYRVDHNRVGRAETFSDVLDEHGVDYQTILNLAAAARPEFDVSDLRAGRPYRVYVNRWLQQPRYLAYQIDALRYIVFDLRHPGRTHVSTRSVRRRWATAAGTVEGSLYESVVENGGHPLLALRLSEVFAWQIDFFRLRAGDSFRLVYEARSVEGDAVQPGDIVAACVRHRGENYYAFRFEAGTGDAEYFNRAGQSLRRQLLKAPLQYSRISSGYTNRRYHPVLKEYRPHRGVDYAAPRGTPVRSVGDGVVQRAGYKGPNGNYVKIRHNGTYTSGYLHLSQIAVTSGDRVQQGETIGSVGSTGRSTGPHLDYRLWKHGTPVNPVTLELPPSQPVPLQHREAFRETVRALLPRLDGTTVFARAPSESGSQRRAPLDLSGGPLASR